MFAPVAYIHSRLLSTSHIFYCALQCVTLFFAICLSSIPSGAQTDIFNIHEKSTTQIFNQEVHSISSYLDSSEIYKRKFDYETSLKFAFLAYQTAEMAHSKYLQAKALHAIGDRYYYNNDMSRSTQYLLKAIQVAKPIGDSAFISEVSIDLGFSYVVNGRPDSALLHAYTALHYYKDKRYPISTAWCYRILGDVQYSLENYEEALQYYKQGADVLQNIAEKDSATHRELSLQVSGVAMVLAEQKSLEESLRFYHKSDSIATLCNAYDVIVGNEYGKSYVYIYSGDYINAIKVCKKAMVYYAETNDQFYLEGCWESLGRAYLKSGVLDSAEHYLLKAEASAIQNNSYEFLKEIYMLLSELEEKKGDMAKSLVYYKLYKQHTDSLYSKDKLYQMKVLEMSQDIASVEKEKQLLEANALQDKILLSQKERLNIFITIALFLAILSAILLGVLYFQKQTKNKQLAEQVILRTEQLHNSNAQLIQANAELKEFAHISFHDLREPLRNISSFATLIRKKGKKITQQELDDYSQIIQFNARQMQILVYDVFEFVNIESNKKEMLTFSPDELVDEIVKLLDQNIKQKSAIISKEIEVEKITSHKGMLSIALRNLVENAVKYNTSVQPHIHIQMHNGNAQYTWYVKDNGIGIQSQYHERIFEMFKRLHNREKFEGSGLGLSITKKIIEKLDGQIGVISEEGEGSTFWFSIPKIG